MICFVYMNVRESARERVRGWGGQRKRVRKCQYQSVGSCVKKIVVAFPAIPVKAQYLSVQVHTYQYECTCTFGTKYQTTLRSYNRRTERLGSHNVCLSDKCLPVLSVTHQLHPADIHLYRCTRPISAKARDSKNNAFTKDSICRG